MKSVAIPRITVLFPQPSVSVLFPFLSKGVQLPISRSCGIKEFLCRELLLDPDYVESRIQTVFLNGRAVDDIETVMIANGDTLALSAAMPGLVGASFRRAGRYSVFRDNVSFHDGEPQVGQGAGLVTVKLFNLIVSEIGPTLLQQGVRISAKMLAEVIGALNTLSETEIDFRLDDQPATSEEILSKISRETEFLLRIQVGLS